MQQQNQAGRYLGFAIFDSFMVSGDVVYELSVRPSCLTETCLCMCMQCHFLFRVRVSGKIVALTYFTFSQLCFLLHFHSSLLQTRSTLHIRINDCQCKVKKTQNRSFITSKAQTGYTLDNFKPYIGCNNPPHLLDFPSDQGIGSDEACHNRLLIQLILKRVVSV